jgi:hypothetical protein
MQATCEVKKGLAFVKGGGWAHIMTEVHGERSK